MDYPRDPTVGLVNGKFTDGDPDGGIPPSRDIAAWGNAVTEELLAVITAAGITPDENDTAQLLTALVEMGLTQATETVQGIIELATAAEVQAGTYNQRAVTPAGLASLYTAADVLAKLLTVDGTNSGLDADLLNGFRFGTGAVNEAGTLVGSGNFDGTVSRTGVGVFEIDPIGNLDSWDYRVDVTVWEGTQPCFPNVFKGTGFFRVHIRDLSGTPQDVGFDFTYHRI